LHDKRACWGCPVAWAFNYPVVCFPSEFSFVVVCLFIAQRGAHGTVYYAFCGTVLYQS